MSEMVERISDVLARLPVRDFQEPLGELDTLRRREAARAILEAMRDPTKKMRNAGIREFGIDADETTVWQVMIDAALP